jgi:hypothetical protein
MSTILPTFHRSRLFVGLTLTFGVMRIINFAHWDSRP